MPNQHSKVTETKLYKMIVEEMSKLLVVEYNLTNNDFHIVRIESPSSPGIPDINVSIRVDEFKSREFWIECKVYPNELGNYQIAWKKKRELAGGRIFVVTWHNENKVELDKEFYLSLTSVVKEILRRAI